MAIRKKKLDEALSTVEPPQINMEILLALGHRLTAKFDIYKRLRLPKEQEWIESLRQHKGIYDPEILSKLDAESSKVYPKVTRAKDNIVLSKLHEMLFPAADRNWSIEPTPEPDVSTQIAQAIYQSLMAQAQAAMQAQVKQANAQGQMIPPNQMQIPPPDPMALEQAIKQYTKAASERMQSVMDDQFIEMKYTARIGKPVLRSGILFGTGIAKGPLVTPITKPKWSITNGKVARSSVSRPAPYYELTPIWNWYPDMTVTEAEDMDGSFERHVYSKHQVRDLRSLKGFNSDLINDYLSTHPNGDYKPESWEQTLRGIGNSPQSGTTSRTQSGDYINMEGSGSGDSLSGDKYVVLEWWGYVSGHELQACGEVVSEDELDSEVLANIWLLGSVPIKAIINPEPERRSPYKLFYYEKDETSIFGEGLPRAIRHSQITISAASRMLLNNGSICSGGQLEINIDLIDTKYTDPFKIFPNKVWIRNGMGVESQYPAVRVFNIDSHIPEYISIIQQFQTFGDIEASLPTWMISEPIKSANETASGVSMKMGTINIALRDLVRNFDDYTEDVVGSLYAWNMEYNKREDIKGDYKVVAHGSTTLISKEVRINALNMLASTLTPEDWAYIPRRQIIEERIKANELDIKLRTEEEAGQYIQSLKDPEVDKLTKDDLRAEITKKQAMALNLTSKARKTAQESPEPPVAVAGQGVEVPLGSV
jgi:hypothetical protein